MCKHHGAGHVFIFTGSIIFPFVYRSGVVAGGKGAWGHLSSKILFLVEKFLFKNAKLGNETPNLRKIKVQN